jgi:predicted nuclease of predicted toxin-antitoxin system
LPKVPENKFIADEGFSFPITSILREKGYDVIWIGDVAPGVDDAKVFEISRKEGRIILTEDKDFGELAIRFKCKTSGIILLRIEPEQKELREEKMLELFRDFSDKLKGHLIIVDEQKIRFRKIEQ